MANENPFGNTKSFDSDSPQLAQESAFVQNERLVQAHPQRIGRYRIDKILGKGGFGLVFLAHDEQLNRPVAIKVPHAKLIAKPEDAEIYLIEARTVANLDHPNIVPVYDVGSIDEFPCFVVSKYIQGTDLASKLRQHRLKYREAAELVATIADALHYAHKQGLVHRDVKPGNILIGSDSKPYVVDFGLALREENVGKGPSYAGTFAYMSPEQARGEGHRVDGRSDIFSLGVVFYEMLAGRQPFRGDTQAEILEKVTGYEPRPLLQYDEKLPRELQRICFKALSKRATERYSSAHEMAEDLRSFLSDQALIQSGASPGGLSPPNSEMFAPVSKAASGRESGSFAEESSHDSTGLPLKIVPKGLRSFDAQDSDFFLELVAGPRDRGGLPDSLRFWKTRIEELDGEDTFSVGLIYGPSGCGKSSLIKAGLLPRLNDDVLPVYVEATPTETELRLLHGLRKRCPGLEDGLGLKASLAALRKGVAIPPGKKVLIVLDQFEQWLHANDGGHDAELTQALRQCDGGRVQCLLLVRDDFWLAVSRFGMEIEIDFVPGQNMALADLFDLDHARKVLIAFGRAFGKLPDETNEFSSEQKSFVKTAVAGLADAGKIVCVRLALFAEMMKAKEWSPSTLKSVGGTKGVGVTFLEEVFSSPSAVPRHRLHQKAARAVLKELIPVSGTNIKGRMRTFQNLLDRSGYANRPKDFEDLIRILDSELRLITPTDPEGAEADGKVSPVTDGEKYYQLTHDYLVPALREWLTRKQKETSRGRAELLLTDRATVWEARPENRQLPSILQWFQIRRFTDKRNWTESERRMMAQATKHLAVRSLALAMLLLVLAATGIVIRNQVVESQRKSYAESLVKRVLDAETSQVPAIVSEISSYRKWVDPLLRDEYGKQETNSRQKLNLGLALLPVDSTQGDFVLERMLDAAPEELASIRDALAPHQAELIDPLWEVVEASETSSKSRRLRAAAALAEFDPKGERWEKVKQEITSELVSVPAVYLDHWQMLFRNVREKLLPILPDAYRDSNPERATERMAATILLAEYAADNPGVLTELLLDADEKQFRVLFPKLKELRKPSIDLLESELSKAVPAGTPLSDQGRDKLAKRQANAAIALLRLGKEERAWPLLKHSPDPRLRSYLIHSFYPLGVNATVVIDRFGKEGDVSLRRALLLILGEYSEDDLSQEIQRRFLPTVASAFKDEDDPGLHSAAEWLLRTWKTELPKLPQGEPKRQADGEPLVAKYQSEITDLRQRVRQAEKELPERTANWERQLNLHTNGSSADVLEGLVARFSMDEADGELAANSVNAERGSKFVGGSPPDRSPGVIGNAVQLGGEGYFDCGEAFKPEYDTAFSYGCWVQPRLSGINASIFGKMDVPNNIRGFDLTVETDNSIGMHLINKFPESYLKVTSLQKLTNGCWHHLFVTYDGSSKAEGVKLFVDGEPTSTRILTNQLTGSILTTTPGQIGQRGDYFKFPGAIDDVRVYDRLLADDEVRRLFMHGIRSITAVPKEKRTDGQQQLVVNTYRPKDELLTSLTRELAQSESSLRKLTWEGTRRWYTNSIGQTLVILPGPNEFLMGSPESEKGRTESEALHKVRINRWFAIASKGTTIANCQAIQFPIPPNSESYRSHPDLPVVNVSWYMAANYCVALSKAEGIPKDQWCFEVNDMNQVTALKPNYLELNGYRLPTEAEMEFASRAGAVTSRFSCESEELLKHYAWYLNNSNEQLQRVGLKKPNDFGLFDPIGNCFTWCQEQAGQNLPVVDGVAEDRELSLLGIESENWRVMRGGSFVHRAANIRCADRHSKYPNGMNLDTGFRIARTYASE